MLLLSPECFEKNQASHRLRIKRQNKQNMISKYYNRELMLWHDEINWSWMYTVIFPISFYNMILVKSWVNFTTDRKTSTVFYMQLCMIYTNFKCYLNHNFI